MALCRYCNKDMGLWAGLSGKDIHEECEREARALEILTRRAEEAERAAKNKARQEWLEGIWKSIKSGEFPSVDAEGGVILENEEVCHFIVDGARRAQFYPDVPGSGGISFAGGKAIRSDGFLPKEAGTLYVTNHRLIFLGQAGTVNLVLAKLMQCMRANDVLTISVANRTAAVHFVLDEGITSPLATVVQTLAVKAKAAKPAGRARRKKED